LTRSSHSYLSDSPRTPRFSMRGHKRVKVPPVRPPQGKQRSRNKGHTLRNYLLRISFAMKSLSISCRVLSSTELFPSGITTGLTFTSTKNSSVRSLWYWLAVTFSSLILVFSFSPPISSRWVWIYTYSALENSCSARYTWAGGSLKKTTLRRVAP